MSGRISDLRITLETLYRLSLLTPEEFEKEVPSYARNTYLSDENRTIEDMVQAVRFELHAEALREGAYIMFQNDQIERKLGSP